MDKEKLARGGLIGKLYDIREALEAYVPIYQVEKTRIDGLSEFVSSSIKFLGEIGYLSANGDMLECQRLHYHSISGDESIAAIGIKPKQEEIQCDCGGPAGHVQYGLHCRKSFK